MLFSLLALAALALVVLAPSWGPGTHLEYSDRLWRKRREVLPHDKALLLGEERAAFAYGSLAADLIHFKTFGGHYNHCHRWTIVDEMLELAAAPAEEAFAFGYLSHLAADTIAHNHFVPYHLARYGRSAKGLGHLYWEVTADRFVPHARWQEMGALKSDRSLGRLDELVHRTVERTILPRGANKVLFQHVLLSGERDTWRTRIDRLQPLQSVRLTEGFLEEFRTAATERAVLALTPGGLDRLAHVDTNGIAAQGAAMDVVRQSGRSLLGLRGPTMAQDDVERTASGFLLGMETPPEASGQPLWLPASQRAS